MMDPLVCLAPSSGRTAIEAAKAATLAEDPFKPSRPSSDLCSKHDSYTSTMFEAIVNKPNRWEACSMLTC